MPRVPVILSSQAIRDRDAAIEYLAEHHAFDAAQRFLNELMAALEWLGQLPESGRPYVDLPGSTVRKANIKGFPERVFYVYDGDVVVVRRILSVRRDIVPEDLE